MAEVMDPARTLRVHFTHAGLSRLERLRDTLARLGPSIAPHFPASAAAVSEAAEVLSVLLAASREAVF